MLIVDEDWLDSWTPFDKYLEGIEAGMKQSGQDKRKPAS